MQRRAVAKIEADQRAGEFRADKCSDTGTNQRFVGFEAFPQDRTELFLRSAVGGSKRLSTITDGVADMPPPDPLGPPKV